MINALSILKSAFGLVDKLVLNKDDANKIKAEIESKALEIESQAQETIRVEMQGKSWLQRNWRPLTMLTFLAMVASRWFGIVQLEISQSELEWVYRLISIGLGGYVFGRSAEKIAPTIVSAMKRK